MTSDARSGQSMPTLGWTTSTFGLIIGNLTTSVRPPFGEHCRFLIAVTAVLGVDMQGSVLFHITIGLSYQQFFHIILPIFHITAFISSASILLDNDMKDRPRRL